MDSLEERKSKKRQRFLEAAKAMRLVSEAIENGDLVRPSICELCNRRPGFKHMKSNKGGFIDRPNIFAHHWNGYENPLDVWWICNRCNSRLLGPEYHNGTVSKKEARLIVSTFTRPEPLRNQCKHVYQDRKRSGQRCKLFTSKSSEYCFHHQP